MASCPHCGTDIQEDFGLVDCPGCGAALFVDIDGNIQAYGEESAGGGETINPESSQIHDATQEDDPDMPLDHFVDSPESEEGIESPLDEVPQGESIDDWNDQEALDSEPLQSYESVDQMSEGLQEQEAPIPQDSPEWGLEDGEPVDQGFESLDNPPHEEADLEQDLASPDDFAGFDDGNPSDLNPPASAPSAETSVYGAPSEPAYEANDMSEISDFGNSEISQAREGNLRYNILLSGIDTADIRESLRDALTDKRFIWDTDALIRSIKDGCLRIEEVTSIKAFVLVSRVADLPIEIAWEQYAINEA